MDPSASFSLLTTHSGHFSQLPKYYSLHHVLRWFSDSLCICHSAPPITLVSSMILSLLFVLLFLLHWLSIPLIIFPTLYANYFQIIFSHLWTALFWTSFIQLHTSYTNLEVYRYLELSVLNRNLCFPIINLHFFLETYLSFLFFLTLIATYQIWKIFCLNYKAFPFYHGALATVSELL